MNKEKPITVDNMSEKVFLKIPFYKRKGKCSVLYINKYLYEKIFKKKYDYEIAKKDILENFLVTLDKTSEKPLGDAYIDYQSDPTDISLNGNKGSGRAFYLYERCNIKGIKTPLATSEREDYNNGKYSLDCAIEECLISNVLNSIDGFSNFQTLAIIDLKEEYHFPHTKKKAPCGLLVRYYEKNELYRFSHRFVNKKIYTREELYIVARKIGLLEGNKFINRFLHGAWSIGNISVDANIIDMDTSFFVKGRHPQWSYTDKYITNYFGYEYKGQIMVIDTILKSKLNKDNVTIEEITKIVEKSRKDSIRRGLVELLGYESSLYEKYKKYFDSLADEFEYLSRVIYDNYDNLNCVDKDNENTYLFDFSRLFRYYEILKQSNTYTKEKALSLLINKKAKEIEYTYDVLEYHEKIKQFFKDIIVDSKEKYFYIMTRAINFIEKLDLISEMIKEQENINLKKKLVKAYLENEDKKYLMARKWMRAELIDINNEQKEEYTNNLINTIIEFYSGKDYKKEEFYTDLNIYKEGILFRKINVNGTNKIFFSTIENLDREEIIIKIKNKKIKLIKVRENLYVSKEYKNEEIIDLENVTSKECLNLTEIGRDIK